jgi:hypothetical protein
MTNFPPVPIINMADYQVNSDEEDEEIKDSTGTTVAVIVQSKMRRLSAEKTRATFASFPVFDAHDVRDDDVDEYIPILCRKGTITGMGYTLKNEEISTKNGQFVKARYVWRNFWDRLDGDKEYYPILDEMGNMMGINSIPKPSTLPASIYKQKQKKMSDYYPTTSQVKQVNVVNSPRTIFLQIVGMQQVTVRSYVEDYLVDELLS